MIESGSDEEEVQARGGVKPNRVMPTTSSPNQVFECLGPLIRMTWVVSLRMAHG